VDDSRTYKARTAFAINLRAVVGEGVFRLETERTISNDWVIRHEGRLMQLHPVMAAILASLHMQTADDLFGTPQGSPRTDKLIAASIQWAREIINED